MEITSIIAYVLIFSGLIFLFLASLGLLRMPDLYSRIQTATKASTMGALLFLVGLAVLQPDWLGKIVIIVVFILLSNPLSSHALARASYENGQYPYSEKNIDKYKEDIDAIKEKDGEYVEN